MQKDASTIPLMFIQTISNIKEDCPNQSYFDSRFQVKKVENEDKKPSLNDTLAIKDDVLERVKIIKNALSKKMKVVCEITLDDNQILVGNICNINDDSFLLDEKKIYFNNVLEINIQTLSYT